MIAVVVALVSLATVVILDITGEQKEPADTVLDKSNEKLLILRNENVDTYYANGLIFSSNTVGSTVKPVPNKNGDVQVVAGVDGTNQVIQNFEMDPVQYDVSNGNINIEFNDAITLYADKPV